MSRKIRADHLERGAVVYVRQSTATQVQHNRESTRRQYKLVDRAVDLEAARRCVEAHFSYTDHIGGMVDERGLDQVNEGLRSIGPTQAGIGL